MIYFTFLQIRAKSISFPIFVFDSAWRAPSTESCAHFFLKSMCFWDVMARVFLFYGLLFKMMIFVFPVASVHDFTSNIFMTTRSNLILGYSLQRFPQAFLFIWQPLQIILSHMHSRILPCVLPVQRLIKIPHRFRRLVLPTFESWLNRRGALLGRSLNALGACLTSHLLRYSVCSETVEVVLVLILA